MTGRWDVLIVGAGPSGLLLAGDLAAAGVSCAVLERRREESNLTRAFAVHARTLEQLDARGVADDLIKSGVPLDSLRVLGDTRLNLSKLPSRYPFVLITPQYETERVLADRARALGAEIMHGVEAVGLRQALPSDDWGGAEVEVRTTGDGTQTLRASYAVGADGARSTVRRALGLPFPGGAVLRSVMLADVRFTDPPPDTLTVRAAGEVFAFVVPFGDGWYRVIAWDLRTPSPDTAPVDLEEIRHVMRRALGTDYGMHDPRWMSRFHSDERQVPRYRAGRVFLIGDAAHVHSPAGGQGMNTGMQDAANLGWKLAAAVAGWAPPRLLDTYHTERHPVGRRVLRGSGALVRLAMVRPRTLRAARDAFAAVATRLPPLEQRMAAAVSGIDIAYPAPRGAHPLVGRRAPDMGLAGGGRLYQALRCGRFVLVAPAGDPVASAAGGWADRVDVVAGRTRGIVLVRPDGYIAWAGGHGDSVDRAIAVRSALAEWCGAPT